MAKGIKYQLLGYTFIFLGILGFILIVWFYFLEPIWLQSRAQANFKVTPIAPTLAPTITPNITPIPTDAPTLIPTSLPSPTPTATQLPHADFRLEVESIALDWITHHITESEETDEPWGIPKTLLDKYGVVDYPHLAFPGEKGIVGIAGHRDISGNPFWSIDKIMPGDEIKITLSDGQIIRYTVYQTLTVKPDDPIFWTTTNTHELRLVSCLVGSTKMRVIIFAFEDFGKKE